MLNKKGIFAIVALMVVLNVFLLYKLFWMKHYCKNAIDNIELLKDKQFTSYETNFKINLLNDGINLDNMVLTDSSNIKTEISSLFHAKEKFLVCRFSELHCQECVIYATIKLLNQSKTMGDINILFWGAYEHIKSLNIAKKHFGIQDMPVYNISNLNIPAEELGYPYYFVLNSDLTISNVFIPDKATPSMTNNYLKMVYKRYFND